MSITIPLGLATAAAFAGAAGYINLSEQPARLALDDISLLKEWKPSYAKGLEMQATLSLVSGLLGIAAWYFVHNIAAGIGGCLMLANWPYTFLVIAPTNRALGAIADHDSGPISRALIQRWGKLHAVRTVLGLAASIAYIAASTM
jgi:hypothetical protein